MQRATRILTTAAREPVEVVASRLLGSMTLVGTTTSTVFAQDFRVSATSPSLMMRGINVVVGPIAPVGLSLLLRAGRPKYTSAVIAACPGKTRSKENDEHTR